MEITTKNLKGGKKDRDEVGLIKEGQIEDCQIKGEVERDYTTIRVGYFRIKISDL